MGIPTLSTLGTHASAEVREEVLAVVREAEVVPLALDGDEGGAEAAEDWQVWLGPKAAPVAWPEGVKDVGDLGTHPRGRHAFARMLAAAEARWCARQRLSPAVGEADAGMGSDAHAAPATSVVG